MEDVCAALVDNGGEGGFVEEVTIVMVVIGAAERSASPSAQTGDKLLLRHRQDAHKSSQVCRFVIRIEQ